MRVASPGSWQRRLQHPSLAGIFADIQEHLKVPRRLLQETPAHLQLEPRSPEVSLALVTPIHLQLLFCIQSISKDSSCGSKGDASSPSPAGPVSPHLFLEATRDKWLDCARASRQDHTPRAQPHDHSGVSKAQGSGHT